MQSRHNKQKAKTKKSKSKKWITISTLLVVIFFAVAYFGGVAFYSVRVMNTVVYNDEKTGITQYSDVDSYVKKAIEDMNVVVKTADTNESFSIPLKSLEPEYSIDATKQNLKSQMSPWKWPVEIFTKNVAGLEIDMNINSDLLKQRLTDINLFDNQKRIASSDAKIIAGENGLEIQKPDKGTQLDADATFKKIQSELAKGELTIDVSDCTIPPVTGEKELAVLLKEAQTYVDTPITLTMGQTKMELTNKEKAAMLTIDDKAKKIAVADDKVIAVLKGINDRFAKTQGGTSSESIVEFGNGKSQLASTSKGVLTMNVNKEMPVIKEALEKKTELNYAPAVKENGGVYTYKNAAGKIESKSRYFVEVSVPLQKAWIYEGGQVLLDADIVTGNESAAKNTPTVRGLHAIMYKQQGATLRGSTVGYTGSQDYNVKVNYWIPFERTGYGFHDAEGWKPYARYGGTYYKTEGSHGCVNMRVKDVKVLFETVENGTPVWVHD